MVQGCPLAPAVLGPLLLLTSSFYLANFLQAGGTGCEFGSETELHQLIRSVFTAAVQPGNWQGFCVIYAAAALCGKGLLRGEGHLKPERLGEGQSSGLLAAQGFCNGSGKRLLSLFQQASKW